jgi:hypothetical protein
MRVKLKDWDWPAVSYQMKEKNERILHGEMFLTDSS